MSETISLEKPDGLSLEPPTSIQAPIQEEALTLAKLFRRAEKELGWCKKAYRQGNSYCAIGAMIHYVLGDETLDDPIHRSIKKSGYYRNLINSLSIALAKNGYSDVSIMNDLRDWNFTKWAEFCEKERI